MAPNGLSRSLPGKLPQSWFWVLRNWSALQELIQIILFSF